MSKPILKARLSEKQWKDVEFINDALRNEYETRRDMMLKRLDVTIQSFKWSDRAKVRNHKSWKIHCNALNNLNVYGFMQTPITEF